MRSFAASLALSFTALTGSAVFALTDNFDTDPRANPEWELYEPVPGATYESDGGFFRVTLPAGVNLDHWVASDRGIQLRRADMPENFVIETHVSHAGSGDPAAPLFPPVDESYLANIIVYFSTFDLYHFGPQRGGTSLVLQRSGTGPLCPVVDTGVYELSLQVKKAGTKYFFSWRATDADPWSQVCTLTAAEPPQYVGVILKSWEPVISLQETFDFDYFKIEEVGAEVPTLTAPCPIPDPDAAWIGMPYVRQVRATGIPVPDVVVKRGPEGLAYDPFREVLDGWTPTDFGKETIELEASSARGNDTLKWQAEVHAPSLIHDDEFDEDPRENLDFWELYEPQTGITYSLVDLDLDGGSRWWRMDVPLTGDLGRNFDTWSTVDYAPQLRRVVDDAEADFLIETRVRIDPETPPPAADEFLSGLLLYFSTFDIIHWNIGQERTIAGQRTNLFLERSGINNMAHGLVNGLLQGVPVRLRIEKRCHHYAFLYQGDEDAEWTLAGTYETDTPLAYVGLVMKTWGDGSRFVTDFDYFDYVEPGPRASFTAAPQEGPEPLTVSFDGSASSSASGPIAEHRWDFGDGATATGPVQSHTYARLGRYLATLTVTDSTGDKGASSKTIDVQFRREDVSPWISRDVGDPLPTVEGGARLEAGGCMAIYAGGKDIGSRADQFHFVHEPLEGDAAVVARISSAALLASAKVGVMLRESLDPGARHASMFVANFPLGAKFSFVRREEPGATTKPAKSSTEPAIFPNAWVKIERKGAEVIGSWSLDGAAWNELSRAPVALPAAVLGGIAATARDTTDAGLALQATLCDISVVGGRTTGPVFHRGDADSNGVLQLTDAIRILGFLFLGGIAPTCMDAGDADDNGTLQLTDAIRILGFLFLGGVPPSPPGPPPEACGEDPPGGALGCVEYTGC
ncbi:MAG: PKD domain-containing protein [Planctomycetes bacterium]|nr:PKD domain-containing protein [Planctomycetota bacterium]